MIAIARSSRSVLTSHHPTALFPPNYPSFSSRLSNHSPLPRLHTFRPQHSSPPPSASLLFMSLAQDPPPNGYRPNVGVCLLNSKNQVFVARRVDLPDSWQMPQGGVDENEDPRAAAIRELQEETGVVSAEIIGEVREWLTYDFPQDVKAKITRLWGKEWKGQAQKWFLFRFNGDESEINVDGNGTERAEFSEWKWTPSNEVLELAVDFKRPVYEKVLQSFSPMLKGIADERGSHFC